ncbi:DUF302 domain-containing protein [Streptomyces griseorubiginosus]|uniref:DUF302 domain-containing protein n=1 Tax=Streptomyces griseorubiginosus TaxID=67304 RepID=UPI0036E8FF0F
MSYDRTVRLAAAVRQALADQGLGILTEIDVQATLKAELGHDMDDYLFLDACSHSPTRPWRPTAPLLLPCNVIVRRDSDHTLVQALGPDRMVTLTGMDVLTSVADEATVRHRTR